MNYDAIELTADDAEEAVRLVLNSFASKPEEGHSWICGSEFRDKIESRKEIYESAVWWQWHSLLHYGKIFGVRKQATTITSSPTDDPKELLGIAMIDFSNDGGTWMVYRELRTLLRAGTPAIFSSEGQTKWGEWPAVRLIALGRVIARLRHRSKICRQREWDLTVLATKNGEENK
jgi:hypothetical protein